MESKKSNKRPYFEQNYEFKLYRKTRKLHFLIQNFLAAYWSILVLNFFKIFVPTTIHKVVACNKNMNYNEIYWLSAD